MRNNKKNQLPIFMQDMRTNEILREASSVVPKDTKVYIVGGAVRNALYYTFFGKKLPQRDYDILFIGNKDKFIENLRKIGFIYGKIRRKDEVVLKKKLIKTPQDEFKDHVFFDIHISKEKSIMKNIKNVSGFTINAFAISLKDLTSRSWRRKVIALPTSIKDLRKKQLRVNAYTHPAMLYACIRFMSLGFKQPPKKEVNELLNTLGNLPKWKYKRNIKKVFNYVGGKRKARQLTRKLGIKEDIFNLRTIKKLKLH